jgi:hypothetical protein
LASAKNTAADVWIWGWSCIFFLLLLLLHGRQPNAHIDRLHRRLLEVHCDARDALWGCRRGDGWHIPRWDRICAWSPLLLLLVLLLLLMLCPQEPLLLPLPPPVMLLPLLLPLRLARLQAMLKIGYAPNAARQLRERRQRLGRPQARG